MNSPRSTWTKACLSTLLSATLAATPFVSAAATDDPTRPAPPTGWKGVADPGPVEPPAPPVGPAPVAAESVITAFKVPPLVFTADHAVTKEDPATRQPRIRWRIKAPADAVSKQYGAALVIFDPVPGVTYVVTQTTYGDDPPVDIDQTSVTVPVPAPTPAPVVPPVVPSPVVPAPVVPPIIPGPVVPPAVVGPLWAVLLWDADKDEPPTTQVRVSPIAKQLLATPIACYWEVHTTKSQDGQRFAAYLADSGPAPVVLFIDQAGKKLGSLPIAATTSVADVVGKAKAIRAGVQ